MPLEQILLKSAREKLAGSKRREELRECRKKTVNDRKKARFRISFQVSIFCHEVETLTKTVNELRKWIELAKKPSMQKTSRLIEILQFFLRKKLSR